MAPTGVITSIDANAIGLKKIASGKVREIFEVDEHTLLFVASDRISAYDVILINVSEVKLRSAQLNSVQEKEKKNTKATHELFPFSFYLPTFPGHPQQRRPPNPTLRPLVLPHQQILPRTSHPPDIPFPSPFPQPHHHLLRGAPPARKTQHASPPHSRHPTGIHRPGLHYRKRVVRVSEIWNCAWNDYAQGFARE